MKYFPTVVNIETVNRYCDARCPMCTIKFAPEFKNDSKDENSHTGYSRVAEIMTLEKYKNIASRFRPNIEKITALNLHGCGEPLLDKTLPNKVSFSRDIGFGNIGFTSNCNLLGKDKCIDLLESGLNCLIPSIDGLSKEVQEEIRPGTRFDKVYENVRYFIEYRDKHNFQCRVLPRMIRQELNKGQWLDYENYWNKLIDPSKGDKVLFMDIHNTGGRVPDFDKKKVDNYDEKIQNFNSNAPSTKTTFIKQNLATTDSSSFVRVDEVEKAGMCPDLFARMLIFASGDVALCSADQGGYYKIGNALEQDIEEIYNSEIFDSYREKWLSNNYAEAKHCNQCTITVSRLNKTYQSI